MWNAPQAHPRADNKVSNFRKSPDRIVRCTCTRVLLNQSTTLHMNYKHFSTYTVHSTQSTMMCHLPGGWFWPTLLHTRCVTCLFAHTCVALNFRWSYLFHSHFKTVIIIIIIEFINSFKMNIKLFMNGSIGTAELLSFYACNGRHRKIYCDWGGNYHASKCVVC